MSRVLVSGGSGYVGRFVVEHLLAHGHEVTVGGRSPPPAGFFSEDVRVVPLVLDPNLNQVDAFKDIDHFVHAAFSHLPGKYRSGEGDDPAGFRRANLDGSVRLFETARRAGIRHCIFLSSRAVYGPQPPGVVLSEEMQPQPDTLYGQVKLEVERHLLALDDDAYIATSLRVTGVYGPAGPGRSHKWQSLFDDYRAGRPVPVRAGTEVHGDDVAAAVRLMLEADPAGVSSKIFNVSDVLVDTRAILAIVQGATGCPHPLPEAADLTAFNPMTTEKIRTIGWMPGGESRLRAVVTDLVASR
ncbi:nucleoside-diphosphate-sugar epimerase [Mycoplana sp. BE70]|uniref:NAD-dependent epimerase/dehydratase family protein n=1 Tax=Mycoplana sp. BE70 TaxID=2817775 RepID=UPI00285AE2D4|nr:NAD(P)-dependent oxidoreductase [Mycoplana sp. BE70]MDR6758878.1 nucleoside-diphosphate-sugar epimerase [Mycoplana sp. BE70]